MGNQDLTCELQSTPIRHVIFISRDDKESIGYASSVTTLGNTPLLNDSYIINTIYINISLYIYVHFKLTK